MGYILKNAAVAVAAGIAATLGVAPRAGAALVVNVGNVVLLENTPGQAVPLTVSGGDAVSGLELLVEVGDGGPELAAIDPSRTGLPGPAITVLSATDGTLFAGLATDITPPAEPQYPQFRQAFTLVDDPPGSVAAAGTFALVTFDTTGFSAGETFGLSVRDTLFTSRFIDPTSPVGDPVPLRIIDGTITLVAVPEPASLSVMAAAALLLRRRARQSGG